MIATLITLAICLWEFGIRGQRVLLLMSAGILGVVSLGVVLVTPKYLARMETLIHETPEGSRQQGTLESHAQGSVEAREELLKASLRTALSHPIFGVGPGNFVVVAGQWHVAHNTYTEIAAEAGFPAVILFLWMLIASSRKLRQVRKLPGYLNRDINLWTGALWAAMAAYIAGAAFASTEYNLFPYFLMGYICALYNIAHDPMGELNDGAGGGQKRRVQLGDGTNREHEVAWSF